jgi:hypothetical protein
VPDRLAVLLLLPVRLELCVMLAVGDWLRDADCVGDDDPDGVPLVVPEGVTVSDAVCVGVEVGVRPLETD